jgi:hypothetical protein
MKRDFAAELQAARPKAEQLTAMLRDLGILHDQIDVERAGLLALVKSDDVTLGDLISLGGFGKEQLLRDVRHTLATATARSALGIEPGGHINHIQEVIVPASSVANWMAEIWFDDDASRYALIGEYIQPIAEAPGWQRSYSVYQAKGDRECDVPGCHAQWYERKETSGGYCVHVCRKHQSEEANTLYMRIHSNEGQS